MISSATSARLARNGIDGRLSLSAGSGDYEQAINPVLAREIAAQEVAQRQMNQLMQAQTNAQIAQYHQAQMMGMQNQVGLLGAFEGFCNCVPARHDMFLSPR